MLVESLAPALVASANIAKAARLDFIVGLSALNVLFRLLFERRDHGSLAAVIIAQVVAVMTTLSMFRLDCFFFIFEVIKDLS